MIHISNNNQKMECDKLAALLHSHEDHAQILQGLFRLSLLQSKQLKQTIEPAPTPIPSHDKKRIGIWESTSNNDNPEYVRDPNMDPLETGMWADCERIPPKSNKSRIVFLGESVARGFFFEPYFSPASVLESILSKTASQEFEVIDLARSDLSLDGVQHVLQDSLKLKPDYIVIFSGNNWLAYGNAIQSQKKQLAETIHPGSTLAQYSERIKETVRHQIDDLLIQCKEIQSGLNIPVFFLMPEFNLADFHSNTRYAVPYMDHQKSSQWRLLLRRAEREEYTSVKQTIEDMTQLDEGTSSLPCSIAAQAALHENHIETARPYFEKAKDAEMWHWLTTPRCYSFVMDHLRLHTKKMGLQLVDLPRVFQQLEPHILRGENSFSITAI